MSSVHTSNAERLKAEGNALFLKHDFSAAYEKYTEALKYDASNAILYCNRAACSLGLTRYMDAATDAKKATDLSPSYAKAWGRLAAARAGLNQLQGAVEAWQRAIAVLPVENLKLAERQQRAQYSAELTAVEKRLEDLGASGKQPEGIVVRQMSEDLPWKRALAMLPTLTTWESSAWVIAIAYQEWEQAISHMEQGRTIHGPQGTGYLGRKGVIEGLTNALIADERVFYIADQDFFDLYNKQLTFEMAANRGWIASGSREVMDTTPKRLATEGWASVRPALSTTVRSSGWGQNVWKDVPYEDKGAIFKPTFVRGVKCLRLSTLMSAYTKNIGTNSKYSLEELLAGAQDLLDELAGEPTEPQHIDEFAHILSFFRYPRGMAYAIQGFYHNHKANEIRSAQGHHPSEVFDHYHKASKAYMEAAAWYPRDEESHPCETSYLHTGFDFDTLIPNAGYFHCALHAMFQKGGQVQDLLEVLDSIKDSLPLVKRIWEYGANWATEIDSFATHFEKDMVLRDKLLQMMQSGWIDRDTEVTLSPTGEIVMTGIVSSW
ncbi:hypothetical protein L226DRAFT_606904 [Lentinus tigrinus ALCF2SS1-7]|uniref:uncharacterized protein n=1 Tax=Lentinus tigrinus ALCF2SS1-7 TaxID=1328758 RepID=UPI00116605FD|nr:hypothetical protein L226DRAFT_606904 [Lentinus tigrinus ALCF2SS1-7]